MKNTLFIAIILFLLAANTAKGQEKTFALEPVKCKLVAPNAFTPNDDGINDFFYLTLTGNCEAVQFEIKIFDRWGRLVFTGDEATDQWDGTYDGRLLKEGVYLWQASLTWDDSVSPDKRSESKKGSLVLIR